MIQKIKIITTECVQRSMDYHDTYRFMQAAEPLIKWLQDHADDEDGLVQIIVTHDGAILLVNRDHEEGGKSAYSNEDLFDFPERDTDDHSIE